MIDIEITALSYRISVSEKGILFGTQLNIEKYINRFTQSSWNYQLRRMVAQRRYIHYCHKNKTLYLPRYDLQNFCHFLNNQRIPYKLIELPLQEGLEVHIPIKAGVTDRNETQTGAINYLSFTPGHLRGLSLLPGMGKTYCTIRTIANIGRRAMIAVAGLVEQWKRSILEFTDLNDEDIYIIQGAPSLTKLLTQIDRNIHPKIILCSLGTMRNYVLDNDVYENYPIVDELMDRLRVGIRVIDEAHLNFWLSMMLDLRSNANINIALTATFDRNDTQVKRIFHAHYPAEIRYGESIVDKYVDIYSYSYSLNGTIPAKAYLTAQGYNHSKFEDYLLRRAPTKLEHIYANVYSPSIYAYYVNTYKKGEKLLVLCATIAMCQWFKRRLEQDLPKELDLKVAIYVSETEDSVLDEADVCISTIGSAGTGTDIRMLKCVLMTVATGSDITNKQTLGRLRKLPNDDTPIYVSTWCREITPHANYQDTRKSTFSFRGNTYTEINT